MKRTLVLKNRRGLHARPAVKLCEIANQFPNCHITLHANDKDADAHSVMSILVLAAPYNTEITISAEGEEAGQALNAIEALINDKFGEE